MRRHNPPIARALFVIVASAVMAGAGGGACASFGADAPPPPPPPGPATCANDLASDPAHCGACDRACAQGAACIAATCVAAAGCGEHALYVGPGGDDANTGCDRAHPKKTLGSATSVARLLGLSGYEIRACKGEYAENGLTLDVPVSLLGGFECSTWLRDAKYGYPEFATANETVLRVAPGGNATATLTLAMPVADSGPAAGPARVDGFRIVGPVVQGTSSEAVRIEKGATPLLSNDVVEGADGEGGGTSMGVHVMSGATPDIVHDRIAGGSGKNLVSGGLGSIGLYSEGSARIHDNDIRGGRGTAGDNAGSVGLYLVAGRFTGAASVMNNTVHGGTGTAVGVASYGVVSSAEVVELAGNAIHGGEGRCTSGAGCLTCGVRTDGAQTLRASKNRIFGGDLPPGSGAFYGLWVRESAGAEITNNYVHAGNAAGAAGGPSFALTISGGHDARVRHNTLVGGSSSSTRASYALDVSGKHANAVFENNLFVGLRGVSESGVVLVRCDPADSGTTIARIDANGFVDFGSSLLAVVLDAACAPHTVVTLAGLSLLTAPAAAPKDNARVSADCGGGEPKCVAPPECAAATGGTGPKCRAVVFEAFDEKSFGSANGSANLATGLRLNATAPCAIARGGTPLADVTTDFFGTPRSTTTPSMGAHEQPICRP